jgi:hypothetical protein
VSGLLGIKPFATNKRTGREFFSLCSPFSANRGGRIQAEWPKPGEKAREGGKRLRNLALCVPLCAFVVKYSSFIFNFFIRVLNSGWLLARFAVLLSGGAVQESAGFWNRFLKFG